MHVALLGDSVFDNAGYVPGEPSVVEQVRQALPGGSKTTLLAVDGASLADIPEQLEQVGPDTTHLFVSAGGNDVLNETGVLQADVRTVAEAEHLLAQSQARFRRDYEAMTHAVLRLRRPAVFCTIYDSIPGLATPARVALTAFNDVILRAAFLHHAAVLDLRLVCDDDADYSSVSEIEPSSRGGAKIARVIAEIVSRHDFAIRRSVVFP